MTNRLLYIIHAFYTKLGLGISSENGKQYRAYANPSTKFVSLIALEFKAYQFVITMATATFFLKVSWKMATYFLRQILYWLHCFFYDCGVL